MLYEVIIPLGIVGLLQVTRTVVSLISVTSLMTGGLGAVDIDKYWLTECFTL